MRQNNTYDRALTLHDYGETRNITEITLKLTGFLASEKETKWRDAL